MKRIMKHIIQHNKGMLSDIETHRAVLRVLLDCADHPRLASTLQSAYNTAVEIHGLEVAKDIINSEHRTCLRLVNGDTK